MRKTNLTEEDFEYLLDMFRYITNVSFMNNNELYENISKQFEVEGIEEIAIRDNICPSCFNEGLNSQNIYDEEDDYNNPDGIVYECCECGWNSEHLL